MYIFVISGLLVCILFIIIIIAKFVLVVTLLALIWLYVDCNQLQC